MSEIQRRVHFPDSLYQAVTAYAESIMKGDMDAGSKLVAAGAMVSHRETFASAAEKQPWNDYDLIARARLGRQYIVKVRFHGSSGALTLQCRWRESAGSGWQIAEIADIGLRSPWLKPEPGEESMRKANG
ncbi:MAG TPA: hypothetical protein VMF50_01510 [Candidatus Binataceae bacterium]|nr:hypothetical protein [Candidatus Binataceae bacterium]